MALTQADKDFLFALSRLTGDDRDGRIAAYRRAYGQSAERLSDHQVLSRIARLLKQGEAQGGREYLGAIQDRARGKAADKAAREIVELEVEAGHSLRRALAKWARTLERVVEAIDPNDKKTCSLAGVSKFGLMMQGVKVEMDDGLPPELAKTLADRKSVV